MQLIEYDDRSVGDFRYVYYEAISKIEVGDVLWSKYGSNYWKGGGVKKKNIVSVSEKQQIDEWELEDDDVFVPQTSTPTSKRPKQTQISTPTSTPKQTTRKARKKTRQLPSSQEDDSQSDTPLHITRKSLRSNNRKRIQNTASPDIDLTHLNDYPSPTLQQEQDDENSTGMISSDEDYQIGNREMK